MTRIYLPRPGENIILCFCLHLKLDYKRDRCPKNGRGPIYILKTIIRRYSSGPSKELRDAELIESEQHIRRLNIIRKKLN